MIRTGLKKVLPNRDYPYMNARVSAKGAKLLDRNDYEQLLKMDSNEIARKLEEGSYGKEINELGSQLEGSHLVEAALRKNLYRELRKLVEISPESLKNVIECYIRRIDVTTYKRIIRWKKSNRSEDISSVVSPGYKVDKEEIESFSEKTLEEIINQIQIGDSDEFKEEMDPSDPVEQLENKLDTAYFEQLLSNAEKVGNQKFTDFVKSELEYENLRTVLRLKKNNIDEDRIRERLINVGTSSLVESCIQSQDLEEALSILSDSKWEVKKDSLENVELQLKVARRNNARRIMRTESMGLASVMAYILSKVAEVKNLRMIIQAKSTDLDVEDVRDKLVIS